MSTAASTPVPQLQITNDGPEIFDATFVKKDGSPAKVNGDPTWSVDNPALATLGSANGADGNPSKFSTTLTPVAGAVGVVTVSCTADSDVHGGAPKAVTASFVVGIIDAEASGATIAPRS